MTSFLRGTRGKEKESLSDWLKLGGICGAFLATLTTLLPPGSALGQELEGFKDTLSLLDAWIADRAASRGQPWLVDWCGSWRFVDLIGKSGHIRTIPMPGWVRQLLDDWSSAAGISSGRLFRRVHRTGRIWGDGLTEKAVWHVVKEFAGNRNRKTGATRPSENVSEALPCGWR